MARDTPAVVRVDLEDESVERRTLPERWGRLFVGGKGLAARYLYEVLPSGADPLGPENVLLFAVGPLTGRLPGEQRYAAVTKSPLTGAFLDSYAGGSFPGALAGALDGALALAVTGRADRPVSVGVEDGEAAVRPATDLWGGDTAGTCEAFQDGAVACVGPAGEHRVRYATIASDGGDHHAGRGGAGAVMGAKRLKAVVARGEPPDDDLDEMRAAAAERFADEGTGRWQAASGTLESVDFADAVGALATRGWREGRFEGTADIGIEAARDGASGRERDDDAYPGDFRVDGEDDEHVPRGGTQMTLGAGLGIDEFDAVVALGAACDRLGVDVISGGNAVAWAVLAAEAGLLERDLAFGDHEGARRILAEVATRETDLGDALADGVEAAAERLGGGGFVPTVKRMAVPSYDPRAAGSMALAYATSDRGACHRRARPVEREPLTPDEWSADRAAQAVAAEQDVRAALWCLVADDFLGEVLVDDGAAWLDAAGIDVEGDLRTLGERVWNLVRLFNVREGFDRDDDSLPAVFAEERPDGDAVDPDRFEAMLDAYYATRGWDPAGRPTAETLARLDLRAVADADAPAGER